jgi:hypothetical protein
MHFLDSFSDELIKVGVSVGWVRSMAGRGALRRGKASLLKSRNRLANRNYNHEEQAKALFSGRHHPMLKNPEKRLGFARALTRSQDGATKTRIARDEVQRILSLNP